MPPYTMSQTAKTWTATLGALATASLGVLAGDTTAGRVLTIVAAVGTAVAVYTVPNAPTHDAADMPPAYEASEAG
jgi:hypothetical protein